MIAQPAFPHLRLGRARFGVRFAWRDHIIGFDVRFDQPDRYVSLIVGVPFVSAKVEVYR